MMSGVTAGFSEALLRYEPARMGAWRTAMCKLWDDGGEPALGEWASDRLDDRAGLDPYAPTCNKGLLPSKYRPPRGVVRTRPAISGCITGCEHLVEGAPHLRAVGGQCGHRDGPHMPGLMARRRAVLVLLHRWRACLVLERRRRSCRRRPGSMLRVLCGGLRLRRLARPAHGIAAALSTGRNGLPRPSGRGRCRALILCRRGVARGGRQVSSRCGCVGRLHCRLTAAVLFLHGRTFPFLHS